MKKIDTLRLYVANESPSFPDMQRQLNDIAESPVGVLATNLSETTLLTPTVAIRRRLSLSTCDNSPTPKKGADVIGVGKMDSDDGDCLMKIDAKLPNANREPGSFARTKGFSRRINLNLPSNNENKSTDKENCIMSTSRLFSPNKSPGAMRQRLPLEDYDPNSQDSGYSSSFLEKDSGFRFTEPCGVPPRKHSVEQSPRKDITLSPKRPNLHLSSPHHFNSLSGGSGGSESMDDGFHELFEIEKFSEDANLPFGLNSLLSNPFDNVLGNQMLNDENSARNELSCSGNDKPRVSFHRSFSVGDNTPNSIRARSCLFRSSNLSPTSKTSNKLSSENAPHLFDMVRCFKRPEPPCDVISPNKAKRRKSSTLQPIFENEVCTESIMTGVSIKKQVKLHRSYSETEATIMNAVHRSFQDPDLIGDFSKPYLLPLLVGRHQDLKTISADTLAELMSGKFDDTVATYSIVDCRYPYEFEGGHIRGAKNIYTKEQILKEFVDVYKGKANKETQSPSTKRKHIVVFHCEFSSERGPNLYRFLRNCDRDHNKECYPSLFYPELYLLDGGYKNFFHKYGNMCHPQAYRPMLHPENEGDLRHFRAKSKSWNGDTKSRLALRHNLKRLGL